MLTRRTLLGAALLAPITARTASASPSVGRRPVPLRLPRPTGPHPVGTVELHLVDPSRTDPYLPDRARELMVSVWYPARAGVGPRAPYLRPLTAQVSAADAERVLGLEPGAIDWAGATAHARLAEESARHRRPVVIFSPGFGVPRGLGSVGVAELASHGYVVVSVDHTYEAAAIDFPGGRPVRQLPQVGDDPLLARATRVADVRFVLDVLAEIVAGSNLDGQVPRGLGAAMDLCRVGVYGHSAGGITAAEAMYADRRVRAGIDLDGTLGYGYPPGGFAPVVRDGLDRPFLLFGAGGTGPDGRPQTHRAEPSWGRFWDASTGWRRDLNLPAGMHYSFIDHQWLIPWLQRYFTLPPEVVASTVGSAEHPLRQGDSVNAYLVAFFDQHPRGVPQRLWLGESPRHPDVRFICG